MAIAAPADTADALDMYLTSLRYLAAADPTALAARAQAGCLHAFETGDAITAAAPTRISSAASRQSAGSLSVQPQISRATDSDNASPSASAATTRGWARARRAQPRWARAAPLVIRVRWISQEVGL